MLIEHQRLAYSIGGLTPAEFWDSTPAEFVPYIRERIKWKEEQDKMKNIRFGTIAAVIANVNRDKKKHPAPYKVSDFFPISNPRPAPTAKSGLHQLYDKMRDICSFMGGRRI